MSLARLLALVVLCACARDAAAATLCPPGPNSTARSCAAGTTLRFTIGSGNTGSYSSFTEAFNAVTAGQSECKKSNDNSPFGWSFNCRGQTLGCVSNTGLSGNYLVGTKCQANCPVGQEFQEATGACVCPSGQELVNGQCVAECPAGQTRDSETGQCEPSCTSPHIEVDGQCMCPPGTEEVGAGCFPPCPTGDYGVLTAAPAAGSVWGAVFCDVGTGSGNCEVKLTGSSTFRGGQSEVSQSWHYQYTGTRCTGSEPTMDPGGEDPGTTPCDEVGNLTVCHLGGGDASSGCGEISGGGVSGHKDCLGIPTNGPEDPTPGTCKEYADGSVVCGFTNFQPLPPVNSNPGSHEGPPDNGVPGTAAEPTLQHDGGPLPNSPFVNSGVTHNFYPPGTVSTSSNYGNGTGSCGNAAGMPSCTQCGGAGQPACSTCGHTGQPACSNCGSYGQPKCEACGGAGQPECGKCKPGETGPQCSSVSGGESCAKPPTCSGSAEQCAILYQTWVIHCEAAEPTSAAVGDKLTAGLGVPSSGAGLVPQVGDAVDVGSWFSEASASGECVEDLPIAFSFGGAAVSATVPFSEWCWLLQAAGLLVLVSAGWFSLRIAISGVKAGG